MLTPYFSLSLSCKKDASGKIRIPLIIVFTFFEF